MRVLFSVLFALALAGAGALFSIELSPAFAHRFSQPVFITVYPASLMQKQFYVLLERKGKIFLVARSGEKVLLLNKEGVVCSAGAEEGLLGMAFAPDFHISHRAYILYSRCNPRKTVISRVYIDQHDARMMADVQFNVSEEILLSIPRPYSNHNGGMLAFGPDGYLYAGIGDGGGSGDPHGNAQKLGSFLGKILRIDVSSDSGYAIPEDNPFVMTPAGARPEIFAYGFRNPYRFSFDQKTGLFYAGDVGQDNYEEVSLVKKGGNYGWNIMEGFHCFKTAESCDQTGLQAPIYEYDHSHGRSIIGGYIYRGKRLPDLSGKYVFADFTAGTIFSLSLDGKSPAEKIVTGNYLFSSLGQDENNELFVLEYNHGLIMELK